ncbi:hypothetical protein Ciccas_000271 [Cichlidogyrus casuarinus]|uniref:Hormone-sensitive lipase n=1 Tax=Cichlidogyrus casuarinus TaxID=1844966 RepID=A0ABD2QNE0_9PLAT
MCLEELAICINIMKEMPKYVSKNGNLFPHEFLDQLPKIGTCDPADPLNLRMENSSPMPVDSNSSKLDCEYKRIVDRFDTIHQDVFYGRCVAFYFVEPARQLFEYLGSIMAGCANSFLSKRKGLVGVVNTVFQTFINYMSPEERGKLLAEVTRTSDIQFCKYFWGLAEMKILTDLPNVLLPSLAICRSIRLDPLPLTIPLLPGSQQKEVILQPVTTHSNEKVPVSIRVLSKTLRTPSSDVKEPSDYIVMHIHGGGFVALNSEAHDVYLRPWAEKWDVPVVSVNYSLAPEAPYPQALDECFYAYCWVAQNRERLGCTPNANIVICGDSAGGNLTIGVCLRAAHLQIDPQPAGACMIYAPMLISCQASPSRMLTVSDPMLPFGLLPRCLLG